MKQHYLKMDHSALALALLQRTDIRQLSLAYSAIIEYDLTTIRPWLPHKVNKILDVGCGLAAIDVRLHQHYPDAEIYLLDRSEINPPKYGKETVGEYYHSTSITKQFLNMNGVNLDQITFIEVQQGCLDDIVDIDLCLSLFSWGWHFPLSVYATEASKSIKHGGMLILDIRNEEGLDSLKTYFELVEKVKFMTGYRCIFIRNETL